MSSEKAVNKIRLLLISEPGVAKDAYMAELDRLKVIADFVTRPDELEGKFRDTPYNGILVDVPTMIRSESAVKNRVTSVMERFPVLRVLYNGQGGIRGVSHGNTMRANQSLESFVHNECAAFSARTIRKTPRSDLVLNVLLGADAKHLADEHERTVTMNVSEQGCFVLSMQPWEIDQPAWMIVNELKDKTPIGLRIHWTRHWGVTNRMPGIGASYSAITPAQLEQLQTLL